MKRDAKARALLAGAFLAAFGSASATTYFRVSADDYTQLMINGSVVAAYDGIPWGEAYGSVDLPPGWYAIDLTYMNRYGSTAFYFFDRTDPTAEWQIVPLARMRSLDASGQAVSGLRADYSTLTGAALGTIYGEGPIAHGWSNQYQGQTAAWAGGLVDTNWGDFHERLTGELYVGPVPEASTWAMFGIGLGMIALANTRQRGRGRPN
ncbi:MAG: hypothetical protein IT509_10450 [Rhodocyclaceae bacterium]|nr:hypothetical protein [Rhodocyclaceae bacterium]